MKIFTVQVGFIDTNCYILIDAIGSCWVIDPGSEPNKITAILSRENVIPTKILLTHGHFDHIEAVSRLKEMYPEIKVYVHGEDVPFLTNNPIWENYLGRPLTSASYNVIVNEGDTIQEGELSASVIATPGHSAGSVCYLIGDSLFTGDTLFAYGGIGRTDLWNSSPAAMRSSLKKLFLLEQKLKVFPGHGPASTLEHELLIRG